MLKSESHRPLPDQPDMFGGPAQADLFGVPAPKAYVPDPRHVRNRLADLLDKMKAAESWPWEPVIARMHRDRTIPYLCQLLPVDESDDWRRSFEAEIARLESI
jgi:hypothetical protein